MHLVVDMMLVLPGWPAAAITYAPWPPPITLKLWGSILHYIFINHTIRPGHAGPPYPLVRSVARMRVADILDKVPRVVLAHSGQLVARRRLRNGVAKHGAGQLRRTCRHCTG